MPARVKRKSSVGQKILISVLILIIVISLLTVGGVAYLTYISGQINHNELNHDDLGIGADAEIVDNGDTSITNIALFGVDQREGQTQIHSDAIIVATVDKKHNKIKLSSIMRDSLVTVEGYGETKITEAYFYGGPQLAVKTINQNFGMNIKEYVTVNFQELAAIIDAVGGIEVNVTEAERLAANVSIKEQSRAAGLPEDYISQAGLQTLSGTQAVAFSRIRYVASEEYGHSDFGRTGRQRFVLQKIFEKAKSMNPLQYPGFVQQFLPTVTTSLDMGEILNLGSIMLRDVEFEDTRFPLDGEYNSVTLSNGKQCIGMDLEATGEKMRRFIYDDISPNATTSTKEPAA